MDMKSKCNKIEMEILLNRSICYVGGNSVGVLGLQYISPHTTNETTTSA